MARKPSSSWAQQNSIDPSEIDSRFSMEDSISQLGSVFTEPNPENEANIRRVRSILDRLPPREADIVEMYYFHHKKQVDIATIFGVSQPTICYRLQRATERIRFLLRLPPLTREDIDDNLSEAFPEEMDRDIIWTMYWETCQSHTAEKLSMSQGMVRHRFLKAIQVLKGLSVKQPARYATYHTALSMVSDNLNILREIPREGDMAPSYALR